jgi:hypothetical protein
MQATSPASFAKSTGLGMDVGEVLTLLFVPVARDPHRAVSLSLVPLGCAFPAVLHDGRIGSMDEANVLHDILEWHNIEAAS